MKVYNQGPGTGKTYSALLVLREVLDAGLNAVYTSITNSAVDDARRRFKSMNPDIPDNKLEKQLKVTTMHSYALDLLRNHFNDIRIRSSTSIPEGSDLRFPALGKMMQLEEDSLEKYRKRVEKEIKKDKDGNKCLVVFLNYAVHLVLLYNLEPPTNDVLVVDEYQDFEQDEVYVIAKAFKDNAVLFGDVNQTLFQFRWNSYGGTHIVATNDGERVQTFRFPHDSCQMLNRFILVKRAITGGDATPICYLMSDIKNEGHSSYAMHVEPTLPRRTKESSKDKPYHQYNKILNSFPILDKNTSLKSLTFSNTDAIDHSRMLEEKFGKGCLSTKYVKVSTHPLYKIIAGILKDPFRSDRERQQNARAIHNAINGNLVSSKAKEASSTSPLVRHAMNVADEYTDSIHTIGDVVDLIEQTLSSTSIPSEARYAPGMYTSISEKRAASTVLSMLVNDGFAASVKGVKLHARKPTHDIGVLTFHQAKGLEADYTIVDFTGKWRIETKRDSIIQYLNILYVGLSRHAVLANIILPQTGVIQSTNSASSFQHADNEFFNTCVSVRNDDDDSPHLDIPTYSLYKIVFSHIKACGAKRSFDNFSRPMLNRVEQLLGSY